jgi:alpha-beta hydrolase superfamily lysophospholipase
MSSTTDKFETKSREDFDSPPTSMHEFDQDDWMEPPTINRLQDQKVSDPLEGQRQTVVFSCPVDHSGMQVYIKGWLCPDSSKPPLIVVHDLGESISVYRDFARRMVHFGFNVYAFDLRGHGRSGRMLGHISNFDDLISDLLQVTAWIRHKESGRLPVIVGQGLGGLITRHFVNKFGKYCRGIVLASPCWKPKRRVPWFQQLFIRTVAELLPTLRLSTRIFSRFTPNASIARFSIIGPIRHLENFKITSSFARELILAMESAEKSIETGQIPTLLLLPETDPLYDYTAIVDQMGKALTNSQGEQFLTAVQYDFSGHRLLSDPGEHFIRASSDIREWVERLFGEVKQSNV